MLAAMRARGENPRPVLERIADDFLDVERDVFTSRGASAGAPWAPGARGGVPSLTGRRERMERSLTVQGARGSRRRITVAAGRTSSVLMGSTHPLAHIHQGGTGPRYARTYKGQALAKPRFTGSLPPRKVVHVGDRAQQRWRGFVADYVMVEAARFGL